MDNTKIKIHLGGDLYLTAEQNPDTAGYHELFVYLEDAQGNWLQDIAMIGQDYDYDKRSNVVNRDTLSVKIWANADYDDYTQSTPGIRLNEYSKEAYRKKQKGE